MAEYFDFQTRIAFDDPVPERVFGILDELAEFLEPDDHDTGRPGVWFPHRPGDGEAPSDGYLLTFSEEGAPAGSGTIDDLLVELGHHAKNGAVVETGWHGEQGRYFIGPSKAAIADAIDTHFHNLRFESLRANGIDTEPVSTVVGVYEENGQLGMFTVAGDAQTARETFDRYIDLLGKEAIDPVPGMPNDPDISDIEVIGPDHPVRRGPGAGSEPPFSADELEQARHDKQHGGPA